MKKLYLCMLTTSLFYTGFAQHYDTIPLQQDSLQTSAIQHLQEVVVTAQPRAYVVDQVSSSLRLLTPIQKLPQNIQVISGALIRDQQLSLLGPAIIRDISGATWLEHWSMYTRINMRGARVSEFRDGMNVTSNWGPLSIDMDLVDRIEFVKGPAGFMMSNGEPSGIMNIVTKKPTGKSSQELSLMIGSFDLYRAAVDLDGAFDKKHRLLYRFNLVGHTENDFRPYMFQQRVSVHPVLTYRIDEKTTFTAAYTQQVVNMADVGSPYAFSPKTFADLPRSFTLAEPGLEPTHIRDQNLFLYLHHQLSPSWKLTVQSAYFHYYQQGSDLWPASLDSAGNMIRSVYNFDVLSEYAFGQFFLNGEMFTGNIRHRILAGVDVGDKQNWYDWSQHHELDTKQHPFSIYQPVYGRPANGLPVFDRSKSIRQRAGTNTINQSYTGLYVQDEMGFWHDMLRITLAARYTDVHQSDYGTKYQASKLTPRVGVSVSVDKQTHVYALFDQSFLPQSGLLRGGKSPKPQTGNNLELGIKKDWFQGQWRTTASLYRIMKNGLLLPDPDTAENPNGLYSLQIGQSRTRGAELDIRGNLTQALQMILNYAYTEAEITKDADPKKLGQPIPGNARDVANGWLTYIIQRGKLKGFGLSAGFSYQHHRSSWEGFWESTTPKMPLPDYFRMDAGLSWEHEHLRLNLTLNNVLNSYLYSGSPYSNFYYWQAEAPRNFRLGITYRL